MANQTTEDLSDVFTPVGIQKLKVGQILIFNYEGSRNEFKITRLNKKKHIVRAIKVTTYAPDEVTVDNASYSQSFDNYVSQVQKIEEEGKSNG